MESGLVDESISEGPRFVTRGSAASKQARKDASAEMAFEKPPKEADDDQYLDTDRPLAQN